MIFLVNASPIFEKGDPNRYIYTSDAETYRPIAEIVEELNVIDLSAEASAKEESEARETDRALKEILEKIGV
jgi:type I restriction enzyme M protein